MHPTLIDTQPSRRCRAWPAGCSGRPRGLDDLDLRLVVVPRPLEQGRQRTDVVRAEHDVDPGGAVDDGGAVLLGQAPAHGDLHARTGVLHRPQVAEVAVELVVGVLAHRARVQDDDVGVVPVGRGGVAGVLQQPASRSESWTFIWQPYVRTR